MLGLKFQDDAADFEAGLNAFVAALGDTAGEDSSIRERRTRRKSPQKRRPNRDRRRAGLYKHRSRKVEAKRDRASSGAAAASAVKRLESYLASIATTFGLEVAERV